MGHRPLALDLSSNLGVARSHDPAGVVWAERVLKRAHHRVAHIVQRLGRRFAGRASFEMPADRLGIVVGQFTVHVGAQIAGADAVRVWHFATSSANVDRDRLTEELIEL
jgi:hypothetical protein